MTGDCSLITVALREGLDLLLDVLEAVHVVFSHLLPGPHLFLEVFELVFQINNHVEHGHLVVRQSFRLRRFFHDHFARLEDEPLLPFGDIDVQPEPLFDFRGKGLACRRFAVDQKDLGVAFKMTGPFQQIILIRVS